MQIPFLKTLFFIIMPVLLLFPNSSYGQIFGRCLDAQTGQPVSGAKIVYESTSIAQTRSTGKFSISKDSSVFVFVLHNQYKAQQKRLLPGKENIILLTPYAESIDEITISAPLLNTQKKRVPAGFSLILEDSIQPNLSAIDVIEQSPGVVMQKGALNTGRIIIRGIGSRSPYATTRIRAYLDEIPLTSGDGNTTVEDLEMNNISRTEIVRGPASALYGSGLGGVIVFHPDHTQQAPFSAKATLQAGPFDQSKVLINAGLRQNNSVMKVNASNTRTTGFRENSDYDRQNAQLMFRQHFGNHSLFFLSNFINLRAEIPSSLNLETYRNSPEKAASNWLEVEGFEKYQKWLSGLTLQSDFSENISNKLSLFFNHTDAYESRPFNILDDKMLSFGARDEFSLSLEKISITAGAEIFRESYQWELIETINGNEGDRFADNEEQRNFINIFGKADFDLAPGWQVSAGANWHFLSFELTDQFPDDEDLSGSYSYDPVLSPRIGFAGEIAATTTLFASVGHGFSAPSVEETLLPEGSINPNLEPEEGINYDLGFRGSLFNERLRYDLTAYYVSLENLLVTKRETEEIFYGINAGKTRHYGLETTLNADITESVAPVYVNFALSHTYMQNQFREFIDDGTDYADNQLPGIPNHFFRSSLKVNLPESTRLQMDYKYSGSMFLDDANTKEYSGHQLIDIKAAKKIFSDKNFQINLQGGINNLLDKHHASMVVVNAPSFGGRAPRYYYPGAPRNAFLRLQIEFKQ
jgi:iron complex outermembrane receptor protein